VQYDQKWAQYAALAKAKGKPRPSYIPEEPGAGPLDDFYMDAFWAAHTQRPWDWGPCPIPVLDIYELGRHRGLSGRVLELYVYLIREMDDEYRKIKAEDAKKKPDADG